jgi:hypothetical protein
MTLLYTVGERFGGLQNWCGCNEKCKYSSRYFLSLVDVYRQFREPLVYSYWLYDVTFQTKVIFI